MKNKKIVETAQSHASTLFDTHIEAELAADLEATMETMVEISNLINLGSGSGGIGQEGVRRFCAEQLIGQFFPQDEEFVPISRTIDGERVVDEVVVKFTHTQKFEHLLPAVKPTGQKVTIAVVVIVGLEDEKVSYELNYWDQAGLLVQLGLVNPLGLPIDPTAPQRLLEAVGR